MQWEEGGTYAEEGSFRYDVTAAKLRLALLNTAMSSLIPKGSRIACPRRIDRDSFLLALHMGLKKPQIPYLSGWAITLKVHSAPSIQPSRQGLLFEGGSTLEHLANVVLELLYLPPRKTNIPYNVLISDLGRDFLFPQV
nr:GDP-L-galactose phosphorylase 1 [Ipomoea batatas]